ncbi:MAG TPA: ABC transporter substrate-binding protein [Prolixibacteraceae bacterium]
MKYLTRNIQKLGIVIFLLFASIFTHAQLPKLVFSPHWLPQAQFAGYYVAKEKGFYKEAGIDVEIVHPTPSLQGTALLKTGKADVISLFLITALTCKSQGLDIVNIGQMSQHSAILIVTKKSSGINELSQLNGKKIGVWKSGFDELPKALIAEKKLKVEWVPILSTVNLFMLGGIDAMTVMSYNEYDQIINSGLDENELNVFPLANLGYDIPEDGLYCLRSTYENKKSELSKFLFATLKGWKFSSENKNIALGIVLNNMQLAHIPANQAHQDWMLGKMLELINPGKKNVKEGELLETDFLKAATIVNKLNNIGSSPTFTDFYKNPNK